MYPISFNLAASWLLEKITEKVVQDLAGTGLQKVGIFNATCKRCNTRQQELTIPERKPFKLTCSNEECRYSCEVFIENLSSMTIHYVEEMQVLANHVKVLTYTPSSDNHNITATIGKRREIAKFFRDFYRNPRNRKWVVSILSFTFMLMIGALYMYLNPPEKTTPLTSVVAVEELNLRDGPGTEFTILKHNSFIDVREITCKGTNRTMVNGRDR